jgi:hypothetical protein
MDAYTIKKMMPRLVVAVIGVNLSWYLAVAFIDITNALGGGIQGLLFAPFTNFNTDIARSLSGGQSVAIIAVILGAAGGILLFSSFAIFVPILTGAIIALFVGYLSLIFRQLLIVALVILSPIIIALWVIPGTNKLAQKTIGFFVKLILMYPIIMALLSVGRIFSAISLTNDGTAPKVIAMIAVFAPYFMIPVVFKFVGGVIASVGGIVNDRTRGIQDLQRKSAHEKAAANRAATMRGGRFDDGKLFGLGKHANTVSSYIARPGMMLNRVSDNRMGTRSRGEYILSKERARLEALDNLQKSGVLDHDVGNEMAVHWGTNGSARKRIKELRAQGRHDLASRLERVQHLTGERYQLAGMDMANSFGKLDDRALGALNAMYDNPDGTTSRRGRAMKQLALGRLREQAKGKGNFATYSSYMDDDGKVHTYSYQDDSGVTRIDQRAATDLAKHLQDAGPGILGQTKQYESLDEDGNKVVDSKTAHINAVARVAADTSGEIIGDLLVYDNEGRTVPNPDNDGKPMKIKDLPPAQRQQEIDMRRERAMEEFVQGAQSGAYNDTNSKVAADRAFAAHIAGKADLESQYNDIQQKMIYRGRDPEGVPIGPPVVAGGQPASRPQAGQPTTRPSSDAVDFEAERRRRRAEAEAAAQAHRDDFGDNNLIPPGGMDH